MRAQTRASGDGSSDREKAPNGGVQMFISRNLDGFGWVWLRVLACSFGFADLNFFYEATP